MNRNPVWFLGAALIFAALMFSTACAVIEPPNPPLPAAKIVPPRIPHSLEGRADCRLCHEKGLGGAPQFPADHAPRPSEICITCHIKPSANGTPQAGAPAHVTTPTAPTPTPATTPTTATPATTPAPAPAQASAKDSYTGKCAACHGINREGGFGPALTPDSLAAKGDDQLKTVISDGKAGTAMPPFKASLKPEEIDALVQFIKNVAP